MKYLIVFVALAAIIATSCTKSKQPESNFDIMISHTWYLKGLVIEGINEDTACYLSDQMTFKKDSTGNHYYSILCDTSQPANLPFHWRIEDNTNVGSYYTGAIQSTILYSNDIGGKPDSSTTLRLSVINNDSLVLNGTVNGGRSYFAIYTSIK